MITKSKYVVVDAKAVNPEKWWAFTDSCQNATVFHTPFMHNAFDKVDNHKAFALFALDENETIVGIMNGFKQRLVPNLPSFLSSRAVIMQSPLFCNKTVLELLLKKYRDIYGRTVLFTEIRNHLDMSEYSDVFEENFFTWEDHLNIVVDLNQSEADLWSQVHTKRRNEIRKAVKNNLMIRVLENDEASHAYRILEHVYFRAKLPLMSFTHFRRLLETSTPKCQLCLFGAFLEHKLIGTMFTLLYKQTIYDYYAGSSPEYYHLNPNDLIPWNVFVYGMKQDFNRFDFGGAGKPSVPYGVRDYKKKFGGLTVNYGRYRHTSHRLLFRVFDIALKIKNSYS